MAPDAVGEELRLFWAVMLPEALREPLAGVQELLGQTRADVKWVEPENLHFTLKFMGGTPGARLPGLLEVGAEVAARHPREDLVLGGLGLFPGYGQPRVVWVGCLAGGEGLTALAVDLDRSLVAAGLAESEARPFSPHLTLGRVRSPRRVGDLVRTVRDAPELELGRLALDHLCLAQSDLGRDGPTYAVLEEWRLGQ